VTRGLPRSAERSKPKPIETLWRQRVLAGT